jgi:predicted alpha-1,2-mannosidase
VAGFVGLYAHGNEPGHHAAYLYNYVNQPWKTQAKVRYIVTRLYSNKSEGLVGNEDCGQLSAWYILSALGFYPVNPCGGIYIIGSPWIKQATINLDNGNEFQISTQNQSYKNQYIQSVTLNGQPYDKLWITHDDIVKGGTMMFIMGEKENKNWGISELEIPSIKK